MANTKGHESSIRRSRTLPPLYGGSQLLGGRAGMYHARIARQVRATLAPLAAKGRPMRTAKSRFAVAHGRPRAPQLGAEAAPIQIIACEGGTEWLRRGESAAYLPDSDSRPMATRSVMNRQSDDAGPCRRCAAALSIAVDAFTYISLGSHARSGLRMRCSSRRAVPCGHRNGASLSATDASNPAAWRRGSTHPDHRMRGWIRLLIAGDHRIANGWGLLRRGACAYGEARIGSSGQTGSGSRYQRLSATQDLRSCRMCSNRTPNLGCAWVAHRDAGSPIRHARKT